MTLLGIAILVAKVAAVMVIIAVTAIVLTALVRHVSATIARVLARIGPILKWALRWLVRIFAVGALILVVAWTLAQVLGG